MAASSHRHRQALCSEHACRRGSGSWGGAAVGGKPGKTEPQIVRGTSTWGSASSMLASRCQPPWSSPNRLYQGRGGVHSSARLDCRSAPDDEAGLVRAITESARSTRSSAIGHTPARSTRHSRQAACIARFGVGHDGIDKAKATAAGSVVHEHTRRPGPLGGGAGDADHRVPPRGSCAALHEAMASGAWDARSGHELRGKTLAIIGCGGIGRARRAHCRVRLRHAGDRHAQAGCAGTAAR